MAAKKIVTSAMTPIFGLGLFVFWPSIQALLALAYLKFTPLQIEAGDPSGPRQFQRYFQNFGVPLELQSVEFSNNKKAYQIDLPLGINVPFTGRIEYTFNVEIKST